MTCTFDPRVLGLALALASSNAAALTVDEARHLLTRTGFGAAPHELRALLPLTRTQAVDRLMESLDANPRLAPPPKFSLQPVGGDSASRLGSEYFGRADDMPEDPALDERLTHRGMQEMEQLRVWWLDRMISTTSPFAERLALFWHGHFTSKYFDVLAPRLLADQLRTLQKHGTRDFRALLHAMLRDPAMLIFLDNAINTRERPNENLAREMLELFTLGVGHYDEEDVKSLASLLAGHGVDFAHGWRYRVRATEVDTRPRRFLGLDGVRTLAQAEEVILAHPRTSRFVAEKLYREFVSTEVDEVEVERLARLLLRHHYALRPVLREMLLADMFWAPERRGALVKSPVELLVGFVRSTGLPLPDLGLLSEEARLLDHELFEPPTVKGWPAGIAWLNMHTLTRRADRLRSLWQCRDTAAQWLNAGDDLLVRFSSQGDSPVRLRVLAEGQEVAAAAAQCTVQRVELAQGVPKPAWELLRVPRSQFPRGIGSIELVFEPADDDPATIFVNWVQIDGRRLPAHLAVQTFKTGSSCDANVPPGMLYCAGRLRFAIGGRQRIDGSLKDRAEAMVNSVIESGTSRVALTLRPAGRRTPASAKAWSGLPLVEALLPVPPMATRPDEGADADANFLALLLDPAYNLK